MVFRSMSFVAALSVASVVFAQTPVDSQVSPDTLRQVKSVESLLVSAVTQAATKLNSRAVQAVSDFKLSFQSNPRASGYVLPTGQGVLFVVDVPGITATSAMLWSRMYELQAPQRNVAGIPTMDPAPMTNPDKEYGDYTRQAIVEAMLDAISLPLKDGQTLTVSVGSSPDPTNPLASEGRRLWLTIKAEDLAALRAKTINRDEAKARISEQRY